MTPSAKYSISQARRMCKEKGLGATHSLRWPRSTNPSTPRSPIPPLYLRCSAVGGFLVHSTAKFLHSTPPDYFTPLQNSFTHRPQIPSLHCKIPSLHDSVSLSSVCPASAGSRNCHLTVTRVTHYARWRVRCMFLDGKC